MEWNDTIMVGDVPVPVEPVAGALGENIISDMTHTRGYWHCAKSDGELWPTHTKPILPAVPPGLTCWDVLRQTWNRAGAVSQLPLETSVMVLTRFRDAHRQCDRYAVICRWHECWTYDDEYPAHMRDMQRYGALLTWIKLHEEAGNET